MGDRVRIDNIVVSNKDIKKLTATVSFDIIDMVDNTKVLIKINDKEYSQLSAKETKTSVSYNINGLQRGINNINIKLVGTDEEYISEPFLIKLKYNPSIEGLACSYSDSTGKFILDFTIVGDELFTYDVDFKLDEDDYSNIMTCQIQGEKSYESVSIMGNHSCRLKVTDGYDIYETDAFSFEIVNQKPILSKVLVTNITNNGTASIHYAVKDIENSVLEHKLNLGGEDIIINPNKSSAFCTYELSNLAMGIHSCYISVGDGIDTVKSENFTIEIFEDATDRKGILKQAKDKYDFAYQSLKEIILSVVSDGIFDYDIENAIIQKAQEYYIEMYSEFNRIAQQSIDIIGTNKTTVIKQDLELQINDVDTAVTNLGNTMETTFKDGILTDTEKDILRNNLDLVAKEKNDIDKDYETLYNNEDLLDPTKTNLLTSYNSFVEAHNNLVLGIDDLINKIGIIDDSDKNNVSALFEAWRTALGSYRTRSLESIDAIAKKKADDSADSVDKKWAEIILDPESGIQAQVGSLSETVGGFDERISTVEVTANGVSTTVSSMQTSVTNLNTRVTNAETKVTQLSNKITSSVTEDDVKSIIEQSPTEIRYGFNDISDYVTITTSGLTVNRGSVACDLLCTPSGHDPIIKLFGSDGNCAIDATKRYNTGWGTAIRLKWDDYNYYYISDNVATIYQYGYESFMFQTDPTYRDKSRIMTPNGTLVFDGSNSYDIYDNNNKRLTYDGTQIVLQRSKFVETASVGGGGSYYDKDRPGAGLCFSGGTMVGIYAGKTSSSTATAMFSLFWDTDANPVIKAVHTSKNLTFGVSGLYYGGDIVITGGNYTSYCAKASHGTHVSFGGNGSASTCARSDHSHTISASSHTHYEISYGSSYIDCNSNYIDVYTSDLYLEGGNINSNSIQPNRTNYYNLGWSSYRWNQLCARDVYADYCSGSDISIKENIRYIKPTNASLYGRSVEPEEILNPNSDNDINLGVSGTDLYEFVKNDLKLCEYNYNDDYIRSGETGEVIRTNFDNKIGFVAQDLQDSYVGQLIVGEWEGTLSYNLNNYVSVLGGALQYEIAIRDAQIESLESTISDLEERIKELENKLK